MIRHVARVSVVLMAVLTGAACGDDDDTTESGTGATTSTATGGNFCQQAQQAVTELQSAFGGLGGAAGNPAALQTAQQGFVEAANAMVGALQSAPPEIASDAATMSQGLQQQLAAVQQGRPPPPFPTGNQAAGNRVENYLQANCGIPSTIVPG